MNNQDQPYAYLVRPHWHRDDVKVFPDLNSLVTRCDDGRTFSGPDSVQVMAVYQDGREVEALRDAYSVPDPASREEAEAFVLWRAEPDHSHRRLAGSFRCDPDAPFEDQVTQYIENSPWRWKTLEEIERDHGGNTL